MEKFYYIKMYQSVYKLTEEKYIQFLTDVSNDCEDDLSYYGQLNGEVTLDATDIGPERAKEILKDKEFNGL